MTTYKSKTWFPHDNIQKFKRKRNLTTEHPNGRNLQTTIP